MSEFFLYIITAHATGNDCVQYRSLMRIILEVRLSEFPSTVKNEDTHSSLMMCVRLFAAGDD